MEELELFGRFWVDKNNNKWNSRYFSKEEALEASKSLINCTDCVNCSFL